MGKKVEKRSMVRTYSAGVFMGLLTKRSKDGKRGVVKNARRMWHWAGAASLSELAQRGTSKPTECMFPQAVTEVELTEIIEVIPMTAEAAATIDAVPIWTR